MKIRTLVLSSAGGLVLLLGVGGSLAYSNIDEIRIGGPLQTQNQQASDLIADILPPPEYVIEAYLEATLLHDHPGDYAVHASRLAKLKADYEQRHAYWLASDLDPSVRDKVTQGSHAQAEAFWNEIDSAFLPALRSGDAARAARSYDRIAAAYAAHRARVDEAVTSATAFQSALADRSSKLLGRSLMLIGLLGLLALVAVAGFCAMMLRRVVSPLGATARAMQALSQGKLDVAIPGEGRKDELGEVASAMAAFREAEIEKRRLADDERRHQAEQATIVAALSESLQQLASGRLDCAIEVPVAPDYEQLKDRFNEAVARLSELIGAVRESTSAIRTGSGEIAQASEDLARRTESNAASLEETAAAVTQMDQRLRTTAEAATRTVGQADGAIVAVSDGRSVAEEAVQAMGRVSESAKGIDNVIEGLDKIAFQTRVLAMNAAVEAGRAGEAGRGFAVVADLVSALAMRAEEEAKRARDQLTVTQTEVVSAVASVQRVDGALADISRAVGEVHSLLATIATDNQAQSTAISQISAAVGAMDQATQQNAAMVEQTSAAARHLAGEVSTLSEQAGRFSLGGTGGGGRRARHAIDYVGSVKPLPAEAIPALTRPDEWKGF